MDLAFLNQADAVTLNFELSKRALENAKVEFEAAKQAFEDLMSQADTQGLAKAKFKLFMEERVKSLVESGLLTAVQRSPVTQQHQAEQKRPRKIKKGATTDAMEATDTAENPAVLEGEITDTFV